MRGTKRSVAALAVLSAALAVAPSASAQEQVTPQFSLGNENAVYLKGSEFTVTIQEGTCPGGPVSLTSLGFVAPVDLTTLRGRFIDSGGPHSATLKCKDTTIAGTAPFFLSDPDANLLHFLDKDEYAPGEAIKIYAKGLPSGCRPRTWAISDGFVAMVQLDQDANSVQFGEAKAIDTPGDYTASIVCGTVGGRLDRFTIKVPAPTTPPTTKPPVRKPPIIKPRGAANTGGGGTA